MPRLMTRPDFDVRLAVFARKPFTANGRRYAPNDAFLWKKTAINPRRVRQLYDAGTVRHDPMAPELAPRPAKVFAVEPPAVVAPAPPAVASPWGPEDIAKPPAEVAKTDVVLPVTMGVDGFPVLGDLSSFTTAQLRQYAADTGVKVGRSRQAQIDHLTVAIQSAE